MNFLPKSSRRRIIAAALLPTLFRLATNAADFKAEATRLPDGSLQIKFPADAASYHRVLSGTDLKHLDRVDAVTLDTKATLPFGAGTDGRFFVVQRVPKIAPFDSDGDCLDDMEEMTVQLTNPLSADTDGDGLSDGSEVELGTDPNNKAGGTTLVFPPLVRGSFRLAPLVAGQKFLSARLEAGFIECPAHYKLSMDPASFEFRDATGVLVAGRVHGAGGVTAPFDYDNHGAWSAVVDFTSPGDFLLSRSPQLRLTFKDATPVSARVVSDAAGHIVVTVDLPDNAELVAFTGADEQRFTWQSASKPQVVLYDSNASYEVRGKLGAKAALGKPAFASLAVGADVLFKPGSYTLGGSIAADLPGVPVAATAKGTVTFALDGTASFDVTANSKAFSLGPLFSIDGPTAAGVKARINPSGIHLSGARLHVVALGFGGKAIDQVFPLAPLDINSDGSFSIAIDTGGQKVLFPVPVLDSIQPAYDAAQIQLSRGGGLVAPTTLGIAYQVGIRLEAGGPFATAVRLNGTLRGDGPADFHGTLASGGAGPLAFGGMQVDMTGDCLAGSGSFAATISYASPATGSRHWKASTSTGSLVEFIDDLGATPLTLGPLTIGNGRLVLRTSAIELRNVGIHVPGVVDVQLSGTLGHDGNYELVFPALPAFALQGFAFPNVDLRLKRQPGSYAAVVAGQLAGEYGDDPVAYWRLGQADVKPVPAAADTVRNPAYLKFPGAWVGKAGFGAPGAIAGDANNAAAFGGASHLLITGSESYFNPGKTFVNISLEAWIKVAKFDRDWQAILTKGDSCWRLHRYANTDQLSFGTGGSANVAADDLAGVRSVNDDKWHHVVAAYDGFCKYLYIDGALDAWKPYTAGFDKNDQPVMIGNNSEQPTRQWGGSIDEVAIYQRALSPAEVADHYIAGGGTVLRIGGTLTLQNAGFGSMDFRGSIGSGGEVSLQASGPYGLGGFSFVDGYAALVKMAGQSPVMWMGGSLYYPNLSTPLSGFRGSLDGQANLDFRVQGLNNLTLMGFPFNNGSFVLAGNLKTMAGTMTVGADTGLPVSFPNRHLQGTLQSPGIGGYFKIRDAAGINVGGFALANGYVEFSGHVAGDAKMGLGGKMNWNSFGVGVGLQHDGFAALDGSYELRSTGSIQIGGLATDSRHWLLKGNAFGIDPGTGKPTFGYGNLTVNVDQFNLTTSGVTFAASASGDSGWGYYGPASSYPAARVGWSTAFALENAALKAHLSATCAAWQRQPTLNFVCDIPGPMGTCIVGHFDTVNQNKPPTGSNWADQVPDGVQGDTFKGTFTKDMGTDGTFSFSTPDPFGTKLFSFTLW